MPVLRIPVRGRYGQRSPQNEGEPQHIQGIGRERACAAAGGTTPAQAQAAQLPAPSAGQAPGQAQPEAQPGVQPAAAQQPAADGTRERFELLTEVAQLKGELRALHTEIDRMHGNAPAGPQYAQPVQYAAQPLVYASYPAQAMQPAQPAAAQAAVKEGAPQQQPHCDFRHQRVASRVEHRYVFRRMGWGGDGCFPVQGF